MPAQANPNDPMKKPMLDRIEAIIREVAGESDEEFLRRMKQAARYTADRANGDLTWARDAKYTRAETIGWICEKCREERLPAELEAHRKDTRWNDDRSKRCGYRPDLIQNLCRPCHIKMTQEEKGKSPLDRVS